MLKMFYESDVVNNLISLRKVAVFGYGSQGHAHAQNLKDSGVDVVVALRKNSKNWAQAKSDGLTVFGLEEAAAWADFYMLLVPDQTQKEVYDTYLTKHLADGKVIAFAHGFNIRFGEIDPPKNVDVVMVAPKSPGHLVRRTFESGQGTPCLLAVHQDASGQAFDLALSYADAIGGTKAGVLETTFSEETETDLFGEQAVLCGGVSELIKLGFETLVENGYPPELAYFECLHEMKLIVDLFYEGGLSRMNFSVSDTAEFGGYVRGPYLLDQNVKKRMQDVLNKVKDGSFANDYLADAKNGQKKLLEFRKENSEHLIEKVGKSLRSKMSWLKAKEPVNAL